MSTLTLKRNADGAVNSTTRRFPRTSGKVAVDFTGYKPQADTHRRGGQIGSDSLPISRPASPTYEEIFGTFKPQLRSTGENMQILRAFMHVEGLPPIPERCSIAVFATLLSRFVAPRRSWQVFAKHQERAARAFLGEWASAVLPRLMESPAARPQPILHEDMIPELAAYYSPSCLNREVR